MKPAISVQNLGKSYRVNHQAGPKGYRTLRESLGDMAMAPIRRLRGAGTDRATTEEFWALKDVSFEVHPGEVVGIIGRNGAGKSTLLKILSRITKPSSGEVAVRGRIGSLLEVGTGFHPELTGRENVYLNGSILGMRRGEIDGKFDEIVAFAEIEKFLDTPVKRYSSGMYVRLAFAVAAHLEPEILIIDEVLAVGDAAFQRKCLGKIGDLSRDGRTIIFVSHQMGAVQALCSYAILLNQGKIQRAGKRNEVVAEYLATSAQACSPQSQIKLNEGREHGRAWFSSIEYSSDNPDADYQLYADGAARFTVSIFAREPVESVYFATTLFDRFDACLVRSDTVRLNKTIALRPGLNRFDLTIKSLHLNPGDYRLELWMADSGDVLDSVPMAANLTVSDYSPTPDLRRSGADGAVTNQFELSAV